MHFGVVKGSVVCSQKTESLKGIALRVLVPTSSKGDLQGEPIVAVDDIGCREGDLVMWISKREASLAIVGAGIANDFPVDAAITGIVDAVS